MVFGFFKKKEEKDEISLEKLDLTPERKESSSQSIELPSISSQQTTVRQETQIDKFSLIESKLENLRIYLEMINSKLDRLEALLKSKGLI
ncbi:MAG: hypothetical protein QXL82_02335 [Candidatus Aenigmatarchaeota archaeon]